jgi:GntR family transcriptional regulator
MFVRIDLSSFVPIYEQIKREIRRRIKLGIFPPGQAVPSIRELAEDLLVNPNTVARAYRELEKEGAITTRRGKGCFVADDALAALRSFPDGAAAGAFDRAIAEARRSGLDDDEVRALLEDRLRNAGTSAENGHE